MTITKQAKKDEKANKDRGLVVDRGAAPSSVVEPEINRLSVEFDDLLSRMQRPGAREAMDRAFHASPQELGEAALAAMRKRG
jgi:hypothetical protein